MWTGTYIHDTNLCTYFFSLFVLLNQIWDIQKAKQVHELYVQETRRQTVAVVCHPTRPVLVTAFKDGSIRVWDSNTYRYIIHMIYFIYFPKQGEVSACLSVATSRYCYTQSRSICMIWFDTIISY